MPVPVINVAAMREWEKATWATGQTEADVIRRVGKRLARRARRLTRADDFILILTGKGHNGDDARAAKEFIDGRKVKVLELLLPETDLLKLEMLLKDKPALIIDGIFGIGLNRQLGQGWKNLINAVNASKIPVLSVDLPSGLNGDTGESFGAAIEAAVTLTIGAPKTGLLAAHAWANVGRLEVTEDVGLIPCPAKSDLVWTLPGDFENFPPARGVADHKGSYGHVAIVAGSFGYHGAGVLSTHGAQRAQPGLVTLFTQEKVYPIAAAQLQAAMATVWQPERQLPDGITAALVGSGMAAPEVAGQLRDTVPSWWRDLPFPLVVDASALAHIEGAPSSKESIRVVTPHPGEAGKMLGIPTAKVQADRVAALKAISKKYGHCWVVLKGNQTLIGRADGEIFVNPSGNPHLAQGGSGDLLGGFIAGLLAQPKLQADVGKTLRYAVWQHGAAADKLQAQRANWTVEDLTVELGNAR